MTTVYKDTMNTLDNRKLYEHVLEEVEQPDGSIAYRIVKTYKRLHSPWRYRYIRDNGKGKALHIWQYLSDYLPFEEIGGAQAVVTYRDNRVSFTPMTLGKLLNHSV